MVTVDVESFEDGSPEQHIWGDLGGSDDRWGITRIMDILERNNVKGTFYLNVYESAAHGTDTIRFAAELIQERGHDLQLHTHPIAMFGIRRMWEADDVRQKEILDKGIELIRDWSGKTPVAHRAGAFGLNSDTLVAARDAGLPVDSSISFESSRRLAAPDIYSNSISIVDDIVEFPITYYYQVSIGSWNSPRLVDIEASSYLELKSILNQAADAGLCSVNIMMHSFSLSRYGVPDHAVAERLDKLLKFVGENEKLEAVTTSELYAKIENADACRGDRHFVARTGFLLTYLRAIENFRKGSKNKIVALAPVVTMALFVAFVQTMRRRTKSHHG